MTHNRRSLLLLGVSAFALTGCGVNVTPPVVNPPSPSPNPTPSLPAKILGYINTIVQAFQKILPSLSGLIPATAYAQIQTWVGTAATVAEQILAVANGGGSVSGLVSTFVDLISKVLGLLTGGGFKVPAALSTILSAAQTLLPFILAAIGVSSPNRAAMASNPDHAHAVLLAYIADPNSANSTLRR